jgi:peptide/nickel transport system substrate-binding protein
MVSELELKQKTVSPTGMEACGMLRISSALSLLKRQQVFLMSFGLMVALALNCALSQQAAEGSEPRQGGTIVVALSGEAESLDAQLTPAAITGIITSHWMERLVEFDEDFTPQPHLAEDIIVSEDGLRYTFPLRQGVLFHNGKELAAEDVVASLERWMQVSTRGNTAAPFIEEVIAVDPYTVEIVLNQPFGPLLSLLAYAASSQAAIYPKEIVERFGQSPITEHIGTGVYQFVEWLPDRYVRVARFEDYQPRDEEGSGFAGRRVAYADEIRFMGVPDPSTRLAGTQTGEFHYALEIPSDLYATIQADERVEAVIVNSIRQLYAHFNKRQGLATNSILRKAINAALDKEQIAIAAVGSPEFWELNHNHVFGDPRWQNDAGQDIHNQGDIERARELAQEAGYAGEAIRWLVSPDYQEHYMASLSAVAQLERAGFNIELQAVEWSTLLDRRAQPELWDVFVTHHGSNPDPALYAHLFAATYPGWWEDEHRDELARQYFMATTLEEQQERWHEFQAYVYEEMPSMVLVEVHGLDVKSNRLHGEERRNNIPTFWGAWLD